MPSGLTLSQEQMRTWIDQINNAFPPNERLNDLLMPTSIRTERAYSSYDAVVYRTYYDPRIITTHGVVQMSSIDSVATWDGHEPEDL